MIFTGIEAEAEEEDTVHGGAMWAQNAYYRPSRGRPAGGVARTYAGA